MRFDMLITPGTVIKGRRLVEAACEGARLRGHDARIVSGDIRHNAVLLLYGLGGPDRLPVAERHMAAGGRLVAFDLGYWDRKVVQRKFRVSIDGFHCPQLIMLGLRPGAQRWMQSGQRIERWGNPDGCVLLIGNAPKSNAIGAAGWSWRMSREIRRLMPKARIIYRPKPSRPAEADILCNMIEHDRAIDDVLNGVSLVVCRHSNVAVDACRLGVPVVCEDGAAAAIYPHTLEERHHQPSPALRREFLHRIAWWQWTTEEVKGLDFWHWMEEKLREVH